MQLLQPTVPIFTSLPTSPLDGQIAHWLVDATNGVIWQMRWRAASSKWEFVGGSPMFDRNDATFATSNTTYVDDGAGSPKITLPAFTGTMDLIITWGAQLIPSVNDLAEMAISATGVTFTGGVDGLTAAGVGTASINQSYSRMVRRTGATSGGIVKCVYRSGSGGSQNFIRRELFVTPVRVG